MKSRNFFDEPRLQSIIKTTIVRKYFWAWAKVVLSKAKNFGNIIGFVDLFSGPGKYKDGSYSTPLEIIESAINEDEFCNYLVTLFNDVDPSYISSLRNEIYKIPNINKLKFQPILMNLEVGSEIIFELKKLGNIPILYFIDPWGYKGLSLNLIESVLEKWGCDCIFFFNYNRINAGLNNDLVRKHMNSIFGNETVEKLREKTDKLDPEKRERVIIEDLVEILIGKSSKKFVIPFCFKNKKGTRTSHYLFFITKNFLGYEIMKDIMAKESSGNDQDVASFSYCYADKTQPKLFEFSRPLEDLEKILIEDYQGKELSFQNLYEQHSVNRCYIKKNYKQVLLKMENENKIEVVLTSCKRRMGTLPDDSIIKFP